VIQVGGEHERQVPDAVQEANQQHGGHNAAPQQARQQVAPPADFLAQREERADEKSRQYFENCKTDRAGHLRRGKYSKASQGQDDKACEMDGGGPRNRQRPGLEPGTVKSEE